MSKDDWAWFLSHDDKEYGPLSHRELLILAGLGKVSSQDHLWAPGFPEWVAADFVPSLLRPSRTVPLSIHLMSWRRKFFLHLKKIWLHILQLKVDLYNAARAFEINQAIQRPAIWLCVPSAIVIILVAAMVPNSKPLMADAANSAIVPTSVTCSPPPPLQIVASPTESPDLITEPAGVGRESAQFSSEINVVKPTGEGSQAFASDDSDADGAIPLPMKKPVVELPLRSVDTKEGARTVQRRLRYLGYLADEDGSWGPRSRLALKQFQMRAHLSPLTGWNRLAERALFSANAPRAMSADANPLVKMAMPGSF